MKNEAEIRVSRDRKIAIEFCRRDVKVKPEAHSL